MTAGNPSPAQPLRIGTRRSPLARAQAQEVRQRLQQAHDLPPEAFKIMPMHAVRHGRCCGCCRCRARLCQLRQRGAMSSLDCLSEHRNHTRNLFHDRFDASREPLPRAAVENRHASLAACTRAGARGAPAPSASA
ncbi:MAG: hypothetical protein GDA40_08050 [Rhodobacteraceae bacterium]|nr:hypothetical protein [Paracoccaceae bacterium]